jgi:hypothetical protein
MRSNLLIQPLVLIHHDQPETLLNDSIETDLVVQAPNHNIKHLQMGSPGKQGFRSMLVFHSSSA